MDAMWISEPRTPSGTGPAWPGDEQRLTYRGLAVQPEPDLEMWAAFDDRWEVSIASSDTLLLTVRANHESALAIAARLAEAKDWTSLPVTPTWTDVALDPLILRLMADYPGMVSLPVVEDADLDDIIPFGPDERSDDDIGPGNWFL